MLGKLLGRLAYWGWRDGTRADRRWARNREERQWRGEGYDWQVCPSCSYGTGERCTCAWGPCRTCGSAPCTCQSGAYGW